MASSDDSLALSCRTYSRMLPWWPTESVTRGLMLRVWLTQEVASPSWLTFVMPALLPSIITGPNQHLGLPNVSHTTSPRCCYSTVGIQAFHVATYGAEALRGLYHVAAPTITTLLSYQMLGRTAADPK